MDDDPKPLERAKVIKAGITVEDLLKIGPDPRSNVVPIKDREGVYVHSFICKSMVGDNLCNLHFMTFSWQADRHRVNALVCPECGGKGRFIHWRSILTESPKMKLLREGDPATEIYAVFPFPDSNLIDDTRG